MSGIAGVWHRDGRPLDPSSLEQMLDRLAHRGGDGRGHWRRQTIGLGQVSAASYPESPGVRQPQVDVDSDSVLTFDGRIDNVEELASALAAAGHPPRSRGDAAIVLQACEAWGIDAPRRLLGDFAFAHWHGALRTLTLARDVRGLRPLCYRIDGSRVAFASELQALVQPPFDQPPPNEGFIAEHLISILNSTTETMFAGVFRLPPASMLVVTPSGANVREYWRVDPGHAIRYGSDAEYEEHFRSLLDEAVRCRLRDAPRAGVLLSGGLDSSAVTASAAAVARGDATPIRTFSLNYPGEVCDERAFAEEVARHCGLTSTIVSSSVGNRYEEDVRQYRDVPTYPSGASAEALFDVARAEGVRVMLTGLGGDEWFTGHPAHFADLVVRGRLDLAIAGLAADRRTGVFDGWRATLWNTMRPLVPDAVLGMARRLVGHTPVPPWIRPSFAARVNLRDRLYGVPRRFGFPTHAQDEQYRAATMGYNVHANEMFDRSTARIGVSVAHPFHDRRLIEFGLALPEEQRWSAGYPKAIVRRACRDRLPPRILARVADPDYASVYVDAMRRLDARARLAADSAVFDEWVDRRLLLEHFDRTFGVPGVNDWPIWMGVAVRLWADEVIEGGARPRSHIECVPDGYALEPTT